MNMQNFYEMVAKELAQKAKEAAGGDGDNPPGELTPESILLMAFAYLSGIQLESNATGKGKRIKGAAFKGTKEELDPFNDAIVGKKPKTSLPSEKDYVLKMQQTLKEKQQDGSGSQPKYDNNDLVAAL